MLETPERIRELYRFDKLTMRKLYQKAKQENCESRWMKMIGKPYSGELNVRFDEGELEIGHGWTILGAARRKGQKQIGLT